MEIEIIKLDRLNTLVIKNLDGKFFISTPNSIIISVNNLATLLNYLVKSGMISVKLLEGILSEVKE